MLEIGQAVPDFNLPAIGGKQSGEFQLSLEDLKGQFTVLYFYPKDMTSGCTKQAEGFRDLHAEFTALNANIIGVSKDSIKSHQKFIEKHELPFILVSDEETKMLESYGVWVEKSMYGKKYMGIERVTLLIDPQGKLVEQWRKVKVPNHVEAVLKAVREQT